VLQTGSILTQEKGPKSIQNQLKAGILEKCFRLSNIKEEPYCYYRCEHGGKHRLPDVPEHSCTLNADDADQAVWQAVAKLLQEPERLAQAWADLNTTDPPNQREIKRLQNRSRQLERQWQRILDAYQDGLLEKDELTKRKKAIDQEQAQLQSLLAQAQEVSQQNQYR
jgi:hypothetical protein